MFDIKTISTSVLFATSLGLSQFAVADTLSLDESLSSLSFVSIKKGSVAEAHSINKLTGSITDTGELNVSIYLKTVETNIPIRNTRMNRHVFESEQNPIATITANVAGKVPDEAGVSIVKAEGELTMRGISKKVEVNAIVTHTGKKVVVSSIKPIIIKAADYGMEAGVLKLQELAKLSSIATAVPVNFSLTFK